MIEPKIILLQEKKLVGLSLTMSLSNNKTGQLWGSFMQRRTELTNVVGNDKFSLQLFPPGHFKTFNPNNEFVKWAAVEVTDFNAVPEGMKTLVLDEGQYAVFHYKGSSQDPSIFQYIYSKWLPASGYILDDKPHFEVLGEKYRNNDPNSEEEIWIPVVSK